MDPSILDAAAQTDRPKLEAKMLANGAEQPRIDELFARIDEVLLHGRVTGEAWLKQGGKFKDAVGLAGNITSDLKSWTSFNEHFAKNMGVIFEGWTAP